MPTFKIDDREIPFEPGDTIIRAAHRAGVEIPHYCYHPGLSVAANCRMCLVELLPPPGRPALELDVLEWDPELDDYVPRKKPKLVPACQQAVSEGMQVKSDSSEHVRRARASVQEFLLLNHPVDCPICDQAGECRLQDYWLEHQASRKRMRDEIVHKPKAVSFGPTMVYDAERCIVCTRCVRVCDELAHDPVLSVGHRGNLDEIVLAPGRQLDHPYTLMTEWVCPVGALTSKDFRFKARVWFLRTARTVCQGCATGCNAFLDFDPRSQRVYRLRPRENPGVNRYWMCDDGILSHHRVHDNRVLVGLVRGSPRSRASALSAAVSRLKEMKDQPLGVVLSAQHSNEDNYALAVLGQKLGAKALFLSGRPAWKGDAILRSDDQNPNRRGVLDVCRSLGVSIQPLAALAKAGEGGGLKAVLALGSDLEDPALAAAFKPLELLVVLAVNEGPLAHQAHVVLPASSWAEYAATYVNRDGVAQLSERAVSPLGESLPAYELVAELAGGLDVELGWSKLAELRKRVVLRPESGRDSGATRANAGVVG